MRINWIVASDMVLDPAISADDLKTVGPIWGSWKSWRGCGNDNVICHDVIKAKQLLTRAFQAVCNLYLPRKYYRDLERPSGAKWYDGDFNQEVQDIEDVIAMHLASESSDLVLLLGFDLSSPRIEDAMRTHRLINRLALIRQIMVSNPDIQWVLIDHAHDMDPAFDNLTNLTRDQFENVLKLLI